MGRETRFIRKSSTLPQLMSGSCSHSRSIQIREVGVSGERSTLHRYFEQISFTHFTFGSVTFVVGGVGTRDPVHSKELDVGSNSSPTLQVREVGVSGERSALHRYFGQNSFTHLTSDVVALVPGGVGARDPVHSKELGVCSNSSPTFTTRKEKHNLSSG